MKPLLPAVIVVGFALLGLKGEGLVRSAWAEEQKAVSFGDMAVLARDTAPVASDPAADEAGSESAAEVDVLSSLAKRRTALDAREDDIAMRTQVLAAVEARIDDKIATLKQLQDHIAALLGERDTVEKAQLASLVKTYSAMKAKDAARIFNNLDDSVLIPVAQAMKSDVLAPILAAMNADAAQKLTMKLADHLKLPEFVAPANPPAASTPTPAAAAPTAAAPGAKPAAAGKPVPAAPAAATAKASK
jgi:flagellar motility protein MotE (MotC chaperone)